MGDVVLQEASANVTLKLILDHTVTQTASQIPKKNATDLTLDLTDTYS